MAKHRAVRRRLSSVAVRRRLSFVVVPLCILLGSALVWGSTEATFSTTTVTGTNSWTTGTVTITNDHSGTAVFSALTGLEPDNTLASLISPATGPYTATAVVSGGSHCILVTYSGSLAGKIHMYATLSASNALQTAMLFTVDRGTGATDVNCTGYTGPTAVYGLSTNPNVYLSAFPSTFTGAGTTGEWAVAGGAATQWYRISWLLPVAASGSAGLTTTAIFTWEIQST